MKYSDLTLATPAENLACDEALLDLCDQGLAGELLRFWEPARYFVVLGYASKVAQEVNLSYCQLSTIPVLRRCTGGGTVLQGPGCLNYSLILRIEESGPLHSIPAANEFIMSRHRTAIASLVHGPVELQGHTDLAIGGLKFSGNAQRRKKRCLIFHGTFLLHLDLGLMEKALPLPLRQPAYRAGRCHSDFLVNLRLPATLVKTALLKTWNVAEPMTDVPFEQIASLAREKYEQDEWSFKF